MLTHPTGENISTPPSPTNEKFISKLFKIAGYSNIKATATYGIKIVREGDEIYTPVVNSTCEEHNKELGGGEIQNIYTFICKWVQGGGTS